MVIKRLKSRAGRPDIREQTKGGECLQEGILPVKGISRRAQPMHFRPRGMWHTTGEPGNQLVPARTPQEGGASLRGYH